MTVRISKKTALSTSLVAEVKQAGMSHFQERLEYIEGLMAKGELEEAHRLAQELYRQNSLSLDYVRLLVKVLYKLGKEKEAKACLKKANLIEVEYHTFFDNLKRDSVVLDLGGWKGNFTDYVHKNYGCEVHIAEPNIKYHEIEKKRFNGLNRVHVYKCAIGGETKLARFYPSPPEYPAEEKGSSLLPRSPYVNPNIYYDVQEYSLYDFVRRAGLKNIDLIKMDIEGAEVDVFTSPKTQEVLNMCQSLTIEFHHRMPILAEAFIEKTIIEGIIQRLKDSGFRFVNFSRDIEFIDCLFVKEQYLKGRGFVWEA